MGGAAADELGLAWNCVSTTGEATAPSPESSGTREQSGRSGCASERTARGARRTSDLALSMDGREVTGHVIAEMGEIGQSAPLHNFSLRHA